MNPEKRDLSEDIDKKSPRTSRLPACLICRIEAARLRRSQFEKKDRTMNHTHYQQLTSQFIDHELGPEDERELFAHLGQCDECRGFFRKELALDAGILATKSSLPRLSIAPNAPHVAPRFVVDLRNSNLLKKLWRATIPAPVAFGMGVVLVAIGLLFAVPRQSPIESQIQSSSEARAVMSMPTIVISQK